ncbi:MAG: hypothetical protein IH604_04885 [Burkholderiales bacterium]|nr:hypothetical protein [Burkholderiales bacterium]
MKQNRNRLYFPQRRRFLKQAASTGLVAGVGPWLASCGIIGSDSPAASKTERRSYYFDLSNADSNADHYLVAGTKHHPVSAITAAQLASLRSAEPGLAQVDDASITHGVEDIALPANGPQLLYVKSISKSADTTPAWSMHSMFYHVPSTAASNVSHALAVSCTDAATSSANGGFSTCVGPTALAAQPRALAATPAGYCAGGIYQRYKSYFDHAVTLVCNHPEICSFDAATLAYVQQVIVCADANILTLAQSLHRQGPASETGGWATQVECVDPDTGQPKLASNGHKLYFTQHSEETLRLTGAAIRSVLPKIKNDPVLGGNIAGMRTNTQDNLALKGKLWAVNSAAPAQAPAPTSLRASILAALTPTASWTSRDLSSGNGYSIKDIKGDTKVDDVTKATLRTVTFTVSNTWLRYLGLYVRYLDGNGKPIAIADLPLEIQGQFETRLNGTHDGFISILNQPFAVLGIPLPEIPVVAENHWSFTVKVPESAASIQILSGGIGTGTNSYPETTHAGAVMTSVVDLGLPGLFLAMAATAAFAPFMANLSTATKLVISTAQIFMQAIADTALAGFYNDPAVFKTLGAPVFFTLIKSAIAFWAEVQASLAAGEAVGVAEDAAPFGIGVALQAVAALGLVATIAETSAEVAQSPWTYATEVSATHDLTVTIKHDPLDVAGFPATATHYRLYAVCDGSSPRDSGAIAMPGTTTTAPLAYTFKELPLGGKVNVSVAFYSSDGWLAGAGATGSIDNTVDTASITIKESLVPLTGTTTYGHKQKIVLDGSGKHVWQATTTAPVVEPPNCANAEGNLCELVGITLSEPFGAVGYAWKASSSGVKDFASGAGGQLYQFANLAFTSTPEAGYKSPGGGFLTPARIAYSRASPTSRNFYIDTSGGSNIVRRITLSAVDTPPSIDLPSSNLAVGKFNFASDAFLIHPTGKLISINTALAKFEVLVPETTPVADASAPIAQAYSGPGTREGLLSGPACAAITPAGNILVLEQTNNRIQAFDTGANPVRIFSNNSSSIMPLRAASAGGTFLDVQMEFVGYLYVLWVDSSNVYTLDIYDPHGSYVSSTSGVNAGKLTVDLFRNVYSLNFEKLTPVGAVTEPSISEWIPSTP